MSNRIIPITAGPRPGRSALDEFLPELDIHRANHETRVHPREIHLEPVEFRPGPVEAPLAIIVERSNRAQLWPVLAAGFVGLGVAILAFVGFSSFAL